MSFIDVTDILLDPMIAGQRFTVVRRQDLVGPTGRTTPTTLDVIPAVGSVVPTGDNSLVREDAFQNQAKTIRVITPTRLRGMAKDSRGVRYQPDLVVWRGDRYVVRVVNDYTLYGAGMVEAECSSIDFSDLPPGELPPWIAIADFSRIANSGLVAIFQTKRRPP